LGVKIQASITFLGTGQGSFVIGRDLLSSGGFVIQVDENQFHVDPGPNSLKNTAQYGINVRANTALLVSHAHLNHSNDVNAVIDAMTYSGLDKNGVLVANKTVVNGDENYKAPLIPYYKDFLERFIVLEAGQRVGINEVEILALKTKHSEQAVGFKFFTPYFTLSYSSDTKYFPALAEEYKNSNILILNVPHLKKEDAKDNLCIEDAIKIIKEVNPRLAVIQHFGIEMVKADPLYQIREIQKATGVQTIAAKDGMVVNPLSYSVDQGQRTLQFTPKERKIEIREEKEPEVKEVIEEEAPVQEVKEGSQEALEVKEEAQVGSQESSETESQDILESKEALKDVLRENP
jgi:ribonuclease BN (tRNA processing enzyme)